MKAYHAWMIIGLLTHQLARTETDLWSRLLLVISACGALVNALIEIRRR